MIIPDGDLVSRLLILLIDFPTLAMKPDLSQTTANYKPDNTSNYRSVYTDRDPLPSVYSAALPCTDALP